MRHQCWNWPGTVNSSGYGVVSQRPYVLAHRAVWAAAHGPIPAGMLVCHHCDNRRCVRPEHLFLGSIGDNNRDAASKGRNIRQLNPAVKSGRAPRPSLETVNEIRRRHASGESGGSLARAYGLSAATISRYVNGDRRNGRKWGRPFATRT